ncbi:hypothetical protein EU538_07040 [Candidatus Thorarchaeota archaeon]|nr:MAG: hypothetical protein EU538_07040 [Candidatus Thorarchaeota archaeon]
MTNSEAKDGGHITRLDSWLQSHSHVDEVSWSEWALVMILAAVLATTTVIHYLAVMFNWTAAGFSLDDSWIHLEYARSIYEGRPWEYSPGVPSTGSTSPLWSILLSSLFLLTSEPSHLILGVHFVSWLMYIGMTFLVGMIALEHSQNLLVSGLSMTGFVIVPRNTWLTLSGMEYPLFGLILVAAVWAAGRDGTIYDALLGVLWGLSYLARPEGAVIIAICVLVRFLIRILQTPYRLHEIGLLFSKVPIALLIALPWILHCLNVTGHPLPDTFYVKVRPPDDIGVSAWNTWWLHWLTMHLFLSIGAIFGAYTLKKKRPFVWIAALSFILLYRFTMPYQALVNNARYLVPAFALLMVAAVVGLSSTSYVLSRRLISSDILCHTATLVLIAGLVIIPSLQGYQYQAQHFGNSVKNINEMQVEIGLWLRENTPPDAVIAITDAGAIRFFSERSIIDIVGLVTPSITHGNMTYSETLRYLHNHGCEYLVLFERWYEVWAISIQDASHRLHTVNLTDNVICAGSVMSVYWVNWSQTLY